MPTKQILFNEESRKAILKGMDIVSDAVGVSLGARGKMVVIGSKSHTKTTKDGVSIARSIRLDDSIEAIGANAIKDVAMKTVMECGDNTTTASILTRAIFKEGAKLISGGYNSVDLKRGIDKATEKVIEYVKSKAQTIELSDNKLNQIATIAANNDVEIGKFVSEAIQKTGKDGIVSLDTSTRGETYIEKVEGLQLNSSYIHPLFINNPEKLSCELINPYILVAEGKISNENDVLNIFGLVAKQDNRPFLVIAEYVDGNALAVLLHNKVKGNYPVCAIRAPSFGENQKRILQDIGVCVGADVASQETGLRLDTLRVTNLGTAEKVIITKDETIIVGGGGKKHDIDSHVLQVRTALDLSSNEMERQQNEQRLAKLLGGIGVIYVGGESELEVSEKKDRYDDAIRASKCAIQEGVVSGGGTTFLRCIELLNGVETSNEDERAGVRVIQKALEVPFIQMAKNAGLENRISISDILKGDSNFGYNFKTDKFENLYESGVLDPAMVLRVALKNAASVAGTLLTSEVLIINEDLPLPPNMQR